jgi:hypothetical protein
LPFTLPLPMTPGLFAPPLLALIGRAILLARFPTPPALRLPLTCLTAKMGSPMPRPEQPFASFEQTLPGPMMTALWPLADVPKKMTLVHGRAQLLPMFKSRSEASTSLRGVLCSLFFDITLQDVPNRAVHRWRSGPVQRAFLDRIQSAADIDSLDMGRGDRRAGGHAVIGAGSR